MENQKRNAIIFGAVILIAIVVVRILTPNLYK
jgi:hypothetical protein